MLHHWLPDLTPRSLLKNDVWDEGLPVAIPCIDHVPHFGAGMEEEVLVGLLQSAHALGFNQVTKQMPLLRSDADVVQPEDLAVHGIAHGINIDAHLVFKQAAKGFDIVGGSVDAESEQGGTNRGAENAYRGPDASVAEVRVFEKSFQKGVDSSRS